MSENISTNKPNNFLKIHEIKCGYYDNTTQRWCASNFLGGVGFHAIFQNTSSKTIKYVHFTVIPKNAVGDAVAPSIKLSYTGPLSPGKSTKGFISWDSVWNNSTIKTAHIENVRIEFMDGSTEELTAESLNLAEGNSKDSTNMILFVSLGIAILVMIIFFALYKPSSSSSYSYTNNTQRNYDRYYDDDEITDFVNNYDGKW